MNIKQLKQDAAQALRTAPNDPYKLTLLHTAITSGASLLVMLISYVLSLQINSTGGLAGIGTRSALASAQTLLSMVLTCLTPFWSIGYIHAALRFARREDTAFPTLLEGFRQWGKVLRLLILRFLIFSALTILCLQVSSLLFAFTPWIDPAMQAMEQLIAANVQSETAIMEAMLPTLIPLYIIFGILLCVVLIPVFYRLRLAELALTDGAPGARASFRISSLLSRGKRLFLFRLDLSFWWYYLGLLLCAGISYSDVLLSLLGINLTGDVWMLLFSTLSILAQLLFFWHFAPFVNTTVATAYDRLRSEHTPSDTPPVIENKWSI